MSEGIVWLHLSDLHRGQSGERTRWGAARKAVLSDLKQMADKVGSQDELDQSELELEFDEEPALLADDSDLAVDERRHLLT